MAHVCYWESTHLKRYRRNIEQTVLGEKAMASTAAVDKASSSFRFSRIPDVEVIVLFRLPNRELT